MKKKKPLIILAIVAGAIVALFVVARVTGALKFYRIATGANEPNLKVGEQVFTSKWGTPQRYDFIAYYSTNNPIEPGKRTVWIHRLIGLPGDQIEIRNGVLYVNGVTKDDSLNLKHMYRFPLNKYMEVSELFPDNSDEIMPDQETNASRGMLTSEQVKQLLSMNIACERDTVFFHHVEPGIEEQYHKQWSVDNFGPVRVPSEHYFVIGDNRHQSADSRFHGFIPKKDLHSVLLGTH